MLLLPIGRDDSEVRRHAWVSYAIIAVNVVLFIGLNLADHRFGKGPVQAKWEEAVGYLQEHPYLVVPEQLAPYLGPEAPIVLERMRVNSGVPYASVVASQQKKLDELAGELHTLVSDIPSRRLAFVPGNSSFPTMISAMFVHADFMHLLGNMLFFFVTAPFIEDVFGRPLFAGLYFFGGIVATWAYALRHVDSMIPLVGASGAVAAVMGASLFRFHRSKLEFFLLPFLWRPSFHFRFFVPAFVVLPFWFLTQLALAAGEDEGAGVAFSAHVGGFVFGLGFAAVMKAMNIEQRFIDPKVVSQTSWTQNEKVVSAAASRSRGDLETARREVDAALQARPDDVDARRIAYEVALDSGDLDGAGKQATRLLEIYLRMKDHDLATELIHEAQLEVRERLPARFLARAASFMEREGDSRTASSLLESLVRSDRTGTDGLRGMMQLARIWHRAGDTAGATKVLQAALASPACAGEWKVEVTQQMEGMSRRPRG